MTISSKQALKIAEEHTGFRDPIFKNILTGFNNNPIDILQIGAIENFDPLFRKFSGWGDLFFAKYIQDHGGSITICDINLHHLLNSQILLDNFNIDANFVLSKGEDYLRTHNMFNLIYLDGSNIPEETKNQFNYIDHNYTTLVLIDDFSIKGAKLKLIDSQTVIRVIEDFVIIYNQHQI